MLIFGLASLGAACMLLVLSVRKSPDRAVTGVEQIGAYYSPAGPAETAVTAGAPPAGGLRLLRRVSRGGPPPAPPRTAPHQNRHPRQPGGGGTPRAPPPPTAGPVRA